MAMLVIARWSHIPQDSDRYRHGLKLVYKICKKLGVNNCLFLLVVPAQQSGLLVNVEFQMLTIRYKKNMAMETLPLIIARFYHQNLHLARGFSCNRHV